MPAEIFEDTTELSVETADVLPFDSDQSTLCWPYPSLVPTGRLEQRSVRIIHLTNELLDVSIAPDLGGRILGIYDRRTRREVLAKPSDLRLSPSGDRGARLETGIELITGTGRGLNSLGSVETLIHEAVDEDSPAAVIVHELAADDRIGWHACFTLPADKAELTIELRIQARGLSPVVTSAGMLIHGDETTLLGDCGVLTRQDAGLHIQAEYPTQVIGLLENGSAVVDWAPGGQALMPRQTGEWKARITPFSGLAPAVVSRDMAVEVSDERVVVQAARDIEAEITVETGTGDLLRASGSLKPESHFSADLSSAEGDVAGIRIREEGGDELLAWRSADGVQNSDTHELLFTKQQPSRDSAQNLIKAWQDISQNHEFTSSPEPMEHRAEPGLQHAACLAEAYRQIRKRCWKEADALLEHALLYCGDDPLTWHLKAAVNRNGGLVDDEAEQPELLNAHFIAPLEPMLRVEGFLAQGLAQTSEPNPMMRPLADHPDAAMEAVSLLLEAGLTEDAVRVLDEIARHTSFPLAHIMQGWLMLTRTRMAAEAAQHVLAADRLPISGPMPWRSLEKRAVVELGEAFPDSSAFTILSKLIQIND